MPSEVLVLCPMRVERDAVAKAIRRQPQGLGGVRVVQTGIGRAAILREIERACLDGTFQPSLVILAGVCGGLVRTADVPPIGSVIDERGAAWTPSVRLGDSERDRVTLIGVDRIVDTPAAKQELAQRTGAAIVDMEAHAFAAECERRALRWGIVRGVSDTPEEMLPPEILNWIDPAGNTRALRAARDLALRPRLIPSIMSFGRRTSRVMPQVGTAVVEMVKAAAASRATLATEGAGGRA